jgi:ADP-heptose:LPS heptosyltransferase
LLIEKNNVNVILVGGPDDVELADSLLNSVLHKDAVASMAGRTSLADLPRLLKHCALYIGNDSGPKHVAAAVGIPTIGIHSGVVDPVEWGPIGPRAVALRRNMTCSPCYLANAEDCPRALACLRLLEPSLVYEAVDRLLGLSRQTVAPPETPCTAVEVPQPKSPASRKAKAKRPLPVAEPA